MQIRSKGSAAWYSNTSHCAVSIVTPSCASYQYIRVLWRGAAHKYGKADRFTAGTRYRHDAGFQRIVGGAEKPGCGALQLQSPAAASPERNHHQNGWNGTGRGCAAFATTRDTSHNRCQCQGPGLGAGPAGKNFLTSQGPAARLPPAVRKAPSRFSVMAWHGHRSFAATSFPGAGARR